MRTQRITQNLHRFRRAFTLIELLIVVAIIGITTTMAVAVVSTAMEGDRFASSARTIQAALAGARDRAIRAKAPRGVRMFVEDLGGGKKVVTSMVYIGSAEPWRVGDITFTDAHTISGPNSTWGDLATKGLIQNGSRIRIPDTGQWYAVILPTPPVVTGNSLTLSRDFVSTPLPSAAELKADSNTGLGKYILELSPTPLPEAEPIRLSGGVAINLNYSLNVPTLGTTPSGTEFMDVVFSPRGTIQGRIEPAGQILPTTGIVYFYLSDIRDITNGVPAGSNTAIDQLLVSVNPQTGSVHSYPVGPPSPGNILQYAQSGVTSAQ